MLWQHRRMISLLIYHTAENKHLLECVWKTSCGDNNIGDIDIGDTDIKDTNIRDTDIV